MFLEALEDNMKKFLSSSLEKLANTLKPYQFKELSKHYPEKLDLVKGKLAYPYEYIDSPKKYDEESQPNMDKFYSSLTDYPENNKYRIPQINKKVPGKFKEELNGQIMTEFVGLRSKLYSFKVFENKNESVLKNLKAKGVKKPIIKNELCFNNFYNCLKNKKTKYIKQNIFRTDKHEIYTVEQNKKALSAYDDKRYILENGINTLAWGHYSTKIEIEYLDNLIKTNN
ncbi:Hypothetical protein CINCED_3A012511 [Cinara cedri]|uniref:Uncharacterized protein n=1 Tax=Cinara cedri TaxID=506608 RepID=A0A5E4NBB4_9HEMI|nr:Hypothetical protein CINCED_3A012511 [Cinara cedri]